MKIFIVQSHLGGGGAERVGVLLANGFALRGYDVFIITDLNEAVSYQVDKNVKVLNMVSITNNTILKWLGAIRNLRRYVKGYRPDVVIGIMQLSAFVSRMACIGINTPVIMTEHDSFERPESAPMPFVERLCKFYLNKIYDCVTVITQADKNYIGNRLKNVVVMSNPLSLSQVAEIPPKTNIILAAGRLDGWFVKGFDLLIRAWALVNGQLKIDNGQLSSTGESWKLQIAGAGSEESLNYLKQLCKENGVEDSVEFLGFRKDVEKLYQDASIFVLSSRYEGFGLVLIEAMSQGCACVACDYKGRQREIISPTQALSNRNGAFEACENGILCEPNDVESLAAGIQKMITDNVYRETVRMNVVVRSDYYSLNNAIERWRLLLTQITNR